MISNTFCSYYERYLATLKGDHKFSLPNGCLYPRNVTFYFDRSVPDPQYEIYLPFCI